MRLVSARAPHHLTAEMTRSQAAYVTDLLEAGTPTNNDSYYTVSVETDQHVLTHASKRKQLSRF